MEKEAPVQGAPRWFISVCACLLSLGSGSRVTGFYLCGAWFRVLRFYLRGLRGLGVPGSLDDKTLKHAYRNRNMSGFPASAPYRGEGRRSATSEKSIVFRNLSLYSALDRDRDNPVYSLSFRGISLRDISAMETPLGDIMMLTRCISPIARYILTRPVDLRAKK
jgi:hypothetical protein